MGLLFGAAQEVHGVFIKAGRYLVGALQRPVQAELPHRDRQADSRDAGGQNRPRRPAAIPLDSEQFAHSDEGVGGGYLERGGGRGSELVGQVDSPATTGGNLRLDVDVIQETLPPGSGDALADHLVCSDQVLLHMKTDQRWWRETKRQNNAEESTAGFRIKALLTDLSCSGSAVPPPPPPF